MFSSSVGRLRTIGLLEGTSFVLLLTVAMPLKYAAGMPIAVKVAGWAHGGLFMLLLITLLNVMVEKSWPLTRGAIVFFAALMPLGPFVIDRWLKRFEDDSPKAGDGTSEAS